MTQNNLGKTDLDEPKIYQIRVKGHLSSKLDDWFDGMSITFEDNCETLISGPVADQAALYGILKKIRDLGLTLISVNRTDHDQEMEK